MWNSQFIGTNTSGDGTTYPPGSFPRYSPVSGISGASQQQLGCCEQFDQDAFAILLAWMTGLTDNATYQKIKVTANHLQAAGPDTTERWEEQFGQVAVVHCGGDRRPRRGGGHRPPERRHHQRHHAGSRQPTRGGRASPAGRSRPAASGAATSTTSASTRRRTRMTRATSSASKRAASSLTTCADFGFLDLVRLGVRPPNDSNVSMSLSPTASASDGNSTVQVTMPNGDIYFHRYNHDNYGESNSDCSGFPANGSQSLRTAVAGPFRRARRIRARERPLGRRLPAVDGRRGQRRLLRAGADLGPLETSPVSRSDGRRAAPPRSTGPRGNTCASPSRSTPATTSTRLRWSRRSTGAPGRSGATAASASTTPVRARTMAPRSRSGRATARARRAGYGTAVTGRCVFSASAWTSPAAAPPTGRRSSSGTATAPAPSNGAGDNRAAS